jgi:hypothetical protein
MRKIAALAAVVAVLSVVPRASAAESTTIVRQIPLTGEYFDVGPCLIGQDPDAGYALLGLSGTVVATIHYSEEKPEHDIFDPSYTLTSTIRYANVTAVSVDSGHVFTLTGGSVSTFHSVPPGWAYNYTTVVMLKVVDQETGEVRYVRQILHATVTPDPNAGGVLFMKLAGTCSPP